MPFETIIAENCCSSRVIKQLKTELNALEEERKKHMAVFIQGNLFIAMYLKSIYRTRAIITRGLYIFYPLFEVHLCTVTFGLMYG